MAKLLTNEVEHIASLAHLDLSTQQIEKFQEELSSVLEYVEQLNEVDTSGIEPSLQINGLENITREDSEIPSQQLSQDEALSNAQNQDKGFFKVKRIL